MKRSRMPKQLKIGGFKYDVIYPYVFANEPTFVGLHEGDQRTIKIAKVFMSIPRSWPKIMESLLHEVIHAIDHTYCSKVMTENETNVFSNHIFALLQDNDLQIHKTKLPETVKIGGFTYAVVHPYEYADGEDYSCSSDNEQLMFRMASKNGLGDTYASEVLFSNMLYLIFCAFSEISCVPRGFSLGQELGSGGMFFQNFVNGLYQVMVDNDLEKILKSEGEMK